jgi:hypothetical protein
MIHIQIVGKDDADIHTELRRAIREKKIRSFALTRIPPTPAIWS